jgi:carboxymethylenebutenolidase
MKRRVIAAAILASALGVPSLTQAVELSKITIRSADGTEVPVEVATPVGKGPFPPVLFIHAKRGYEGDERAHVRELAEQGFLVVAPDWQSAAASSSAGPRRTIPTPKWTWRPASIT